MVVFKSIRCLLITGLCLTAVGCGQFASRELRGTPAPPPEDFRFLGKMSPCYLELSPGDKAIRVNCFHIDGLLHIHSSRWAKLPRLGVENWIVTVRRDPRVRVEINQHIYAMQAIPIEDEASRVEILTNRGYWHAWDGITVVRFLPSAP